MTIGGGLLQRLGVELEGKLSSLEVLWRNYYHLMTEETGNQYACPGCG